MDILQYEFPPSKTMRTNKTIDCKRKSIHTIVEIERCSYITYLEQKVECQKEMFSNIN